MWHRLRINHHLRVLLSALMFTPPMKTEIPFQNYSRRQTLGLALGALAATIFGGQRSFAQSTTPPKTAAPDTASTGPFQLPPLPYPYDALEPSIDEETMRIHHDKHHGAYVRNANQLLANQPELAGLTLEEVLLNLDKAPATIRTGLLNNVGGHLNHSLFWTMMAPGGGGKPSGPIAAAIQEKFGSFEAFQNEFNAAASSRFGSGWAWLVVTPENQLTIISTPNQNPPILEGNQPVLGLDVWEHAYYLKYQNRRGDYIKAWWNVVNWQAVGGAYEWIRARYQG